MCDAALEALASHVLVLMRRNGHTEWQRHGIAKFAPIACAGPLLVAELNALTKALDNPARPLVAIVGGSKVSTKLTVLDSLSKSGIRFTNAFSQPLCTPSRVKIMTGKPMFMSRRYCACGNFPG